MFLLLSLLICFSTAASARDKDDVKKGEFLKKELGLSDEQLSKVKAIKKELRPALRESKKKMLALKNEFKDAMQDSSVSSDTLTQKFETLQDAKEDFQRRRFQVMLRMREILSPEQLSKFHEVRKKYRARWHKNKGEDQ